ncbi:nucleoside 2-deoxyribosyltransferase domain-containing protein [Streptomyces xiamenensis]|uniref:nucleoside 2-deoxyribosyltransferase domain-containing protein n=1 Tax=Streptomyces xiamenensis TaxID=408015 RepID=UPI0035D8B8F2
MTIPSSSPHHIPPAAPRASARLLYVEAPNYYRPQPADPPAVFLAGGITGVERWHDRAVMALERSGVPVVILNPNRVRFPISDPSAAWEQVSWEQHHLHLSRTLTLLWFPACDASVTTQPIAMYELGQALGEGRPLVVGADPGYPREPDVHMLCQLARPGMAVYSDLEHVVQAALLSLPSQAALGMPTASR